MNGDGAILKVGEKIAHRDFGKKGFGFWKCLQIGMKKMRIDDKRNRLSAGIKIFSNGFKIPF